MLACAIGFIITILFDGFGCIAEVPTTVLVTLGANNIGLLQHGEIWRLLSYMFLHGSLLHLLINMYSLYIIGTQIENYYGKTKYVLIYIISGICGGLLSAVATPFINPGKNIVSIGASGAIFGLVAALLYFG